MGRAKSILSILAVVVLISCEAASATPLPSPTTPKAYAVFMASMDFKNQRFTGGVAGTAFFVSARKAITAFHVLKTQSFTPPSGFAKTQIWLVHENEPAIELRPSDLESRPDQDMTLIRLDESRRAPARLVFETAAIDTPRAEVEAEGFRANSTGPILQLDQGSLRVTQVPHLERLAVHGEIQRQVRVDLKANDVRLKEVPCLQLSYRPVVGLSGGPVVSRGRVVGMNSFADPGTRQSTWAVDLGPAL